MASKEERNEALREKQRASDQKNLTNTAQQRRATIRHNLTQQINNEKAELEKLKEKKEQYMIMKDEIYLAGKELRRASKQITDSKNELKSAYTGQSLNLQLSNYDNSIDKIEQAIATLKSVGPEIERNIEKTNNEITDKEYRIWCLNNDLARV